MDSPLHLYGCGQLNWHGHAKPSSGSPLPAHSRGRGGDHQEQQQRSAHASMRYLWPLHRHTAASEVLHGSMEQTERSRAAAAQGALDGRRHASLPHVEALLLYDRAQVDAALLQRRRVRWRLRDVAQRKERQSHVSHQPRSPPATAPTHPRAPAAARGCARAPPAGGSAAGRAAGAAPPRGC